MKLKLLASAAIVAISMSASAQTRMTLHEEFTGENCPPCASTNPGFWSLCNSNSDKLIHITYVCPIPSAGAFYNSQSSALSARTSYYSVPFAPYGRYDGAVPNATASSPGHPGFFSQADIDAEAAIASPFKITATYYTSHDTVFGKVKVKAVAAKASNFLKLRVAFTKTYKFVSSVGTNGEKDYENVVRKMFTCNGQTSAGTTGASIDSSWAIGDSATYTYSGVISGLDASFSTTKPFTVLDSNFVVWVQEDNTTKAVLQAAESTWQIPTTSVPTVTSAVISNLNVYPNPAVDQLNIQCGLEQSSAVNVTITNAVGQVVIEKHFAAAGSQFSENISLGNVSNGVYLVTINANNESVTKQFTVNK